MRAIRLCVILAVTAGCAVQATDAASRNPTRDIETAYNQLVSASDWRDAKAASAKLSEFGDEALPLILKGTKHDERMTREYCYEILRSKFQEHPRAIKRIIDGLKDDVSMISYPCAFHLGGTSSAEAKEALSACMRDKSGDSKTRYAAAKSLAQLGDDSVMAMLYVGLGSDDHYTRYLSNIGIKALTGRDLSDFGYASPWEGAFVSGPAVGRVKGQPIEKAKRSFERWQAIVGFLEWLKADRPRLFQKLEEIW